jgi:hypothetical protein
MSRGAAKRTHQENQTLLNQLWKGSSIVFILFVFLRLIFQQSLMEVGYWMIQGGTIVCWLGKPNLNLT